MHIVTCGDGRAPTTSAGASEPGPGFPEMIAVSARQARRFGHDISIFDLGGLGMGEPFEVEDPTFRAHGYYRQLDQNFRSKALHKPAIIKRALERAEHIVYLDGDAVLAGPFVHPDPEADLVVTMRLPYELETPFWQRNQAAVRFLNAGVIFFRASPRVHAFVDRWAELTAARGSDQWGLNELVSPAGLEACDTVEERAGLRVRYVSTRVYNFYHFRKEAPGPETCILHFKGGTRAFFRDYFPV